MKGGRVICVLWTLEEDLGVVVVGPGAKTVEVVQDAGGPSGCGLGRGGLRPLAVALGSLAPSEPADLRRCGPPGQSESPRRFAACRSARRRFARSTSI